MKATFITVITLFVLLAVGLVVGPSFVDWSQYKDQAQGQIKKHTGYDAALNGDLSLALLPFPHLSVEDVVIKAGDAQLASLKRLDVNVALAPLFSGDIVVNGIELVEPNITIGVKADGAPTWKTAEIEALMSKNPEASAPKAEGGLADSVSLESVSIEQGRFSYKGSAPAPATVIEGINLDIAAETLKGPFEIDGDLLFAGKPLEIEATAGAIEPDAQSISLKAKGNYSDMTFDYAGLAGIKEPFEVQGEAAVSVASLADFLKAQGVKNPPVSNESASFKGIVTANKDKIEAKNSEILLMGQRFAGNVDIGLSPMVFAASLKGQDTLNLDQLLPKGNSKGGDITQISNSLPKTLSMPAGLAARLDISVPAVILNGQTYSAVDANLSKQGGSLKADVKAKAPGNADMDVSADLTYASKSVSEKTKAEIFADPVLNLNVKATAPNVAATAQALTGKDNLPYISAAKTGNFDVKAAVSPGAINLSPSTVTLDEQSYKLSGSLKGSDVIANIGAMGGELIVKGALKNGAQISNMAVQVKHPSLPQAVKTFSKSATTNPMLTGPVDFYTEVQQDGTVYKLSNIAAKIMNTSMSGALSYDGGAGKPAVTGDLKFGDLVIPSAGTAPAAKGGAGQWSTKPIDTGLLYAANADLNIQAESIKFEKWDVSKPALQFKLSEGALAINQLDAGLFGGQLAMSADIKGAKGGPLSVASSAKLDKVRIEQLVDALVGNKIIKGTGEVNLDTNLSTSGANQAALIRALSGQGTTTGSDIVLEGFDLTRFARALSDETKPGDTLLGVWKGATKGGSTAFDTMDGAFAINGGVVNISKLDLDGPAAAVGTTGNVNLPNWTIATAHTISVKNRDDVPPFTVNISGSLSNPGNTFAQGALQDYFTRKLNRKLEKVISDKLGDKLGGGGNDALNNLLGGVLGTAPAQQKQQAPQAQPAANDNAQPEQVAPAGGDDLQPAPAVEEEPARQQQQPQQRSPATPEEAFRGLLEGLAE